MKRLPLFLFLLIPPLIMAFLIKFPLFKFALGSTDTWITFWGSYLGAIIGAAIVYLVTNIQIKEQRNIQLESIKEEHNNALKRDMQQYHFQNEINKIEEFYQVIEDINDTILRSVNDFTKYITFSHILYGGTDEVTPEQELEFKSEIKRIKNEYYSYIHTLTKFNSKINRLSLYIDDSPVYVSRLSKQLALYLPELKNGYLDKHSYKNYIHKPNESTLSHHLEEFLYITDQLIQNVLYPKLAEKILEMKKQHY